jgi:hypothetical protein
MKKLLLIIICFLASQCYLLAQPQWKFHIAFEDATGAKDTIWLTWDTSASGGVIGIVDTLLGEGKTNLDYLQFNTFLINDNYDTTKTLAFPFQYSLYAEVKAINYIPPINISWDSSLFHKPGIPLPVGYVNVAQITNDYFFLANNDPYNHVFNMLLDNQVTAPDFLWGTQHQFPLDISIARNPNLGINYRNILKNNLSIFPNPSKDHITINTLSLLEIAEISSADGKNSFNLDLNETIINEYNIEIVQIPSGFYFLKLIDSFNNFYYEKIIVQH